MKMAVRTNGLVNSQLSPKQNKIKKEAKKIIIVIMMMMMMNDINNNNDKLMINFLNQKS